MTRVVREVEFIVDEDIIITDVIAVARGSDTSVPDPADAEVMLTGWDPSGGGLMNLPSSVVFAMFHWAARDAENQFLGNIEDAEPE